jgi:uncharacterized protein YgiM (DUF1202 family)
MNKSVGENWMKTWLLGAFLLVIGLFTVVFGEESDERGMITGTMVNLRESASLTARILTVLPQGNLVIIKEREPDWVRVKVENDLEGWINRKYIITDVKTMEMREQLYSRSTRITGLALQYLGYKYRYGGTTPHGFDCSGFTLFIYSQFGWKLPHNAAAQMELGSAVYKDGLIPGDLVFFKTLNSHKINHVGIYVGNGNFVHAASGAGYVKVSSMNDGYYKSKYYCARRLV